MYRKIKLDKEERSELAKLRKEKIETLEKDLNTMKKRLQANEKILLHVVTRFDEIVKEKLVDKKLDQEIDKTLNKIEKEKELKNDRMFV